MKITKFLLEVLIGTITLSTLVGLFYLICVSYILKVIITTIVITAILWTVGDSVIHVYNTFKLSKQVPPSSTEENLSNDQ